MSAATASSKHPPSAPGAFPDDESIHDKVEHVLSEAAAPTHQTSTEAASSHTQPEVSHQPDRYQHGGASEATYSHPTQDEQSPEIPHLSEKEPSPPQPAQTRHTFLNHDHPKKQGPPGGYDATPIQHRPPGYNVRITFHRATKLPIGDLPTLSSDPYLHAELFTDLPTRHKEDPPLRFRTRTLFNTTDPDWQEEWLLENVPGSGFKIKARIYDEDRGDADDRLGNVHISVGRIDERWEGITEQPYKIKKRMGSKRAYLLRAIAVCMRQVKEMSGNLYVSVEVLGRSSGDEGGRAYTVGLQYWCKHYAPLLGRIVGSKNDDDSDSEGGDKQDEKTAKEAGDGPNSVQSNLPGAEFLTKKKKREARSKVSRYNFQANQMQLQGPVPPELYHRFVEFKPFIKALFTASGIRGIILQKALHHQHAQVYNFNQETKYGVFKQGPCEAMTQRFLDLCHHGEGGRMFTYVITLDALMRFTETGKEFGIDLLSKHTMHSDASIYIAYSGEFFIRRRQDMRHHRKAESQQSKPYDVSDQQDAIYSSPASPSASPAPQVPGGVQNPLPDQSPTQGPAIQLSPPPHPTSATNTIHQTQAAIPMPTTSDLGRRSDYRPFAPTRSTSAGPQHSPSHYELIIDNDSGTYRPNAALLPLLHNFLSANFPGLRIITLDCIADAELMGRLKAEQRSKKKAAQEAHGGRVIYQQVSASSSSSESSLESSDVEALDSRAEETMLEDARRREGGTGTGQGRSEGRVEGRSSMRGESVPGPAARNRTASESPEPKHRLGEAVLPFAQSSAVRQYLTEPSAVGRHDGCADVSEVQSKAGTQASGGAPERTRSGEGLTMHRSDSGRMRQALWETVEGKARGDGEHDRGS